ncbi:hypothetical protein [Rubellimicrobium aerolatum]|uniref:Uncharacterized protein n=1 Tax=Rubellimicrobium aerolatum TaxID=490979 RepID=A0ABW0S9X8_9RHOB|nr:hypothetical protein [Rubellimicrobium aerolatum]MBP1805079.1 hypothetical protein [Rubellimicrobium aerolatum]
MRSLALSALLLAAGPALAETVPIRGGEHAEYTRLVVGVPDGAIWTLVPVPGGFELRMPPGASYDLSRAFDKIPRTRVRALDARGLGRLGLTVDCDCHVQTQALRGVGLVLDVIDGPGPLRPGAPSAPAAGPGLIPLVAEGRGGATLLAPPPPPAEAAPDPEAVATMERVAESEEAILESFADAASQGFLDLAPTADLPEPVPPAGPPMPEPSARVLEPGPPQDFPRPAADAGPGIAFRTATDRPTRRAALGSRGTACLPDETFDLAAWTDGVEFEAEIPPRLARISDERERFDPEAIEDLARAYLVFGFGREARQTLGLDGVSSRERDLLTFLARLIDGEPAPADVLEDQAGCTGPVALWRALSRGSIDATDERERTAMTVALRALPDPARALLAPRLADLFLTDGAPHEAQAVADMADAEDLPTDAQLTQATILKETEGPEPALAELRELAETDPRMTPAGMVDLIDLSIREGRALSEDDLELARSLRFEHGGEDGRALLLAEARALTAATRFDEALSLLLQERRVHPGPDLETGLAAAVLALTDGLEDGPFLELALARLPADLPPPAVGAVANRLEALGFPDEARRLGGLDTSKDAAAYAEPIPADPAAGPSRLPTLLPPDPLLATPGSRSAAPGLPTLLPPTAGSRTLDVPSEDRAPPRPEPQAANLQSDAGLPPALLPVQPAVGPTSNASLESAAAADSSSATVTTLIPMASDPAIPSLPASAITPPPGTTSDGQATISLTQGRILLEQAQASRDRALALLGPSPSP